MARRELKRRTVPGSSFFYRNFLIDLNKFIKLQTPLLFFRKTKVRTYLLIVNLKLCSLNVIDAMKNFAIIYLVLFLFSCQKNEIWKQPMDLIFSVTINEQGLNGGPGDLTFSNGYIKIENITISGELENADDFSFYREFPGGLMVPFLQATEMSELKFTLPQGKYNSLKISFETSENNNENNLLVEGIFVYNNPNKDPAKVEITVETPKIIEIDVADEFGSKSFELIDGEFENPSIVLNPPYWFKNITASIMNGSNTVLVNNEEVIVISNNHNINIFTDVESRIGGDTKSVIKMN